MRYKRSSTAVLAVASLVVAAGAQGAVLCKKNKTAAVFVRDVCGKKETQINLNDFLSGSGGGGSGGGGGTFEPEIDRSGSRLHVRYFTGADGSRQFDGFFDTQRGEVCWFGGDFERASDGKIRCLPLLTRAAISFFQDAACMQRLVQVIATQCPMAKYGYIAQTSQCPRTIAFYPIGAAFSGSTAYYFNGSGQCVVFPSSVASFNLYTVGSEIPPSTFVEAAEVVE